MIEFSQILECTVEHTPAGRRNGIDCGERNVRGLVGVSRGGDLYRYNYATKAWYRWYVDVVPTPPSPSSSNPPIEA